MWKNNVEPDRPRKTIRNIRIACWVPKATNMHSIYVIVVALHGNDGFMNAPNYYVICTLSALLKKLRNNS